MDRRDEIEKLTYNALKKRMVHFGLILDYPPAITEHLEDISESIADDFLSFIEREESRIGGCPYCTTRKSFSDTDLICQCKGKGWLKREE